MIRTAQGIVTKIEYQDDDIEKITAIIEDQPSRCINYKRLAGNAHIGDVVLVNTVAMDLHLGTGGYHFVLANLSSPTVNIQSPGHIMKLRYTPLQINCNAVEAQESAYHDIFNSFKSLNSMPVIIGSLHSMAAPCSIYMKNQRPNARICYIMTDGGALPLSLSDAVRRLKEDGYVDATITYGNAFGGDFECINIYTALIAAKEIAKADAAIICMGPGIVGTDTKYGFSGIEQGQIIDAVNKLGGYAIPIPRISFSDKRERHYGISHHSITVLKDVCCSNANIPIPILENKDYLNRIRQQINENKIESLHNIIYVDSDDIGDVLYERSDYLYKMGKGYSEDKEYFIGCAAAGKLAVMKIN